MNFIHNQRKMLMYIRRNIEIKELTECCGVKEIQLYEKTPLKNKTTVAALY